MVYSIGQASKRTGIPASALRFYERKGLIPAPARKYGQRRFNDEDLSRLEVVNAAKLAGFSLGDIKKLLAGIRSKQGYPKALGDLAKKKLPQIEEQVKRATVMQNILRRAAQCRCLTLAECVEKIRKMAGAKA